MGMFGGGKGKRILGALAEGMATFSAGMGNPAGAAVMQSIQGRRQSLAEAAMAEREYQRRLADQRETWLQQQQWKAQNPEPDDLGQMMQRAGIDPSSPEGQALYRNAVQNKANPFVQMRVQNPDGSESLQFTRPPSAPTAPVGKLTPIDDGGAGSAASPLPFRPSF